MKLSRQHRMLLDYLIDCKEHCASEWAGEIKDDRTRFSELKTYMAEKGFIITSISCRGSVCGRKRCPLNKRQAVPLKILPNALQSPQTNESPTVEELILWSKEAVKEFDKTI